jgi:hypothetical protein
VHFCDQLDPLTVETTTEPNENLTMMNTTTVPPGGADGSLSTTYT